MRKCPKLGDFPKLLYTPKHYSPYHWDLRKGTLPLGNLHWSQTCDAKIPQPLFGPAKTLRSNMPPRCNAQHTAATMPHQILKFLPFRMQKCSRHVSLILSNMLKCTINAPKMSLLLKLLRFGLLEFGNQNFPKVQFQGRGWT